METQDNLVRIVEVGPRDGLQNEKQIWSVSERVNLIDQLSRCGFDEIEVGSFVSPKWVPQMIDTDLVYNQIQKNPQTLYSVLVPNSQGLEKALACGVKNISVFTAASETFNKKNINCSIEKSFSRFGPIFEQAKLLGIRVRGYVSCVIECPYEGLISARQVSNIAQMLNELGCDEISLGDTIGSGTPESISELINTVSAAVPIKKLAVHCHDTYGNAIDNIMAALSLGIRTIDSAIFGLGGCPYAGGKAKGNVATELVVSTLANSSYRIAIDTNQLNYITSQMNLLKVI